jgi:hypothetical protein
MDTNYLYVFMYWICARTHKMGCVAIRQFGAGSESILEKNRENIGMEEKMINVEMSRR